MNAIRVVTACVLLIVAVAASAGIASADSIFTVTVNTVPLMGLVGPFAVAFQLTDGSGLADGNNTAILSNFLFGGGSATGCPPAACTTTGSASGDLTGSVKLTDTDFFNSFAEQFTVGNTLSFIVDLTTNMDAGGTPDTFAFSLFDNGSPIPTLDPLGADTLLSVDIRSVSPTILTFATDPSRTTISLAAPVIGAAPSPVPEPGTLWLMAIALVALVGVRRARRQA